MAQKDERVVFLRSEQGATCALQGSGQFGIERCQCRVVTQCEIEVGGVVSG